MPLRPPVDYFAVVFLVFLLAIVLEVHRVEAPSRILLVASLRSDPCSFNAQMVDFADFYGKFETFLTTQGLWSDRSPLPHCNANLERSSTSQTTVRTGC